MGFAIAVQRRREEDRMQRWDFQFVAQRAVDRNIFQEVVGID
jgi:hypothetical protein